MEVVEGWRELEAEKGLKAVRLETHDSRVLNKHKLISTWQGEKT